MPSFAALLLVDAVAVATLARCFDGPSELLLLVPVCVLAHLLGRGARLLAADGRRGLGGLVWAVALVALAYLPVAALDGGSLSYLIPLGPTGHLLGSQLSSAWQIFANEVSPVETQRGLVLAAAWAAGAVGLAAEALDADTALPKVVALIPAFDIVVFTGTLGTPTGRAPELAVLAALGVWYLALAARRPSGEQVVTARLEGTSSPTQSGLAAASPGRVVGTRRAHIGHSRSSGRRPVAFVAPGLLAVAAVAAGLLGPLLPGATSAAIVAWHGNLQKKPQINAGTSGAGGGSVRVSTLVQVGEQEVDNTNTDLFRVYSPIEGTREQLVTLDQFNGNQWTSSAAGTSASGEQAVPTFSASLPDLEKHPQSLQRLAGENVITQVVAIQRLVGNDVPAPGTAVSVAGIRAVRGSKPGSPLVTTSGLDSSTRYAVRAVLDPPVPTITPGASAPAGAPPVVPASMDRYLALPGGLPPSIARLARSIVGSAFGESNEALSLQSFFSPSNGFRYQLPTRLPSGAIGDQGEGYRALDAFLFDNRTGYCQQYASAFAVLARAAGLPSRVVVGFLAGTPVGSDGWEVTGQQVHAWPQVWFPGTGWVDFEPTPGTAPPVTITTVPSVSVPTTPGGHGGGPTTVPAHNFKKAPGGPGGPTSRTGTATRHARPAPSNAPLQVVLGLLAAALVWVLGAPLARTIADRRAQRDPARGVLSSWRATQRVLAVAGSHRRRSETYDEFARRVRLAGSLSSDADAALLRLAGLANKAAFSLRPPTLGESASARSDAHAVQRAARRRLPRWQRLAMTLDPRPTARVT